MKFLTCQHLEKTFTNYRLHFSYIIYCSFSFSNFRLILFGAPVYIPPMLRMFWYISLLIGLLFSLRAQSPIRGVWVVRTALEDSTRINQLLRTAKTLGFTDLFVQVRGRGDAYYSSQWEPKAPTVAADFDPLAYLLAHPLRKHFRIHAWINVFYIWSQRTPPASPLHLVNQHPDWLERPANAQFAPQFATLWQQLRNEEGLYLSPHSREAQLHLLRVIQDILQHYSVDGLHLDYIRYPGSRFGYHPDGVQQFTEQYQLNPYQLRLVDVRPADSLLAPYEVVLDRWSRFLQQQLNRFVWRVHRVVRQQKRPIILSAAVKPDLSRARWTYYQDWGTWLQRGWIDLALPMNYEPDNAIFLWRIDTMLQQLPPQKIVMGISLYNQPAIAALNKMTAVTRIGLRGVVLFSYQQIENNSVLTEILEEFKNRE